MGCVDGAGGWAWSECRDACPGPAHHGRVGAVVCRGAGEHAAGAGGCDSVAGGESGFGVLLWDAAELGAAVAGVLFVSVGEQYSDGQRAGVCRGWGVGADVVCELEFVSGGAGGDGDIGDVGACVGGGFAECLESGAVG